ncbi:MAG: ribH [Gammaproteobacteria bacterium]|jgi:6,7-dimethyl-8-ribityllumazine synthase|nr:ribH [Gammaproteobacteria bacterium]
METIIPKDLKNHYKIAIVVSQFNQEITDALLAGAIDRLNQNKQIDITVVKVPGAIEIPLTAQWLANQKQADGIIALGAVIFGETDHYHYVCDAVNQACMRVMLDNQIPVGFGVLTVREHSQALARSGGNKGNVGAEAAQAVLNMLSVKEKLTGIS